jgi:hypothetical protein
MEPKLIKENSKDTIAIKQKEIEAHKKIASQLMETAALHIEAAENLEKDCMGVAFLVAINAFGLLGIAREAQKNLVNGMMF